MVFERATEYLDEYIRHRERFEERIGERFPAARAVRSLGTGVLKSVRGLLPKEPRLSKPSGKKGNHR
jgi:hypothetical protein